MNTDLCFKFTAVGLGHVNLDKFTNIASEDGEDGDKNGGPCFVGDADGLELRLRFDDKGQLSVQTRSKRDEVLTEWTHMRAERLPSWYDFTGRKLALRGYDGSTVQDLRDRGWHVPLARLGEYADSLYPGLIRTEVEWLGRIDANGDGFRLDPSKEDREEELLHLVAYVGDEKGKLSKAVLEASCFMDHPFGGLSVHVVTALPKDRLDFCLAAIVGPSGSGKTALATELFGAPAEVRWSDGVPVRLHFPEGAVGEEVLSAVGLQADVASRPIVTLSGGEQFRARLARLLIHPRSGRRALVLDEFTSVLDRPAARHLSGQVQAYIRSSGLRQVVFLSCHMDIIGKGCLEPDWVFEASNGQLLVFGTIEDRIQTDLKNLEQKRSCEAAELESSLSTVAAKRIKDERTLVDSIHKKIASVIHAASAGPSICDAFAPTISEAAERLGQQAVLTHEHRIEELEAERAATVAQGIAQLAVAYAKREDEVRARQEAVLAASTATPSAAPPAGTVDGALRLEVRRALLCDWARFREHHYKDHRLAGSSIALVATLFGEPVAFLAMIPAGQNPMKKECTRDIGNVVDVCQNQVWKSWRVSNYPESWLERELWREHRTVVLPNFQGFGLGSLLADCAASLCEQMGYSFISVTVHPTYGGYRDRSPFWSALPSNQNDRNTLGGNKKFSHAWVGANRPDGSIDPLRQDALRARVDWESLAKCVQASGM